MEFAEVTIKESPGLCRCCLSEGCYKDLGTEYTWMNETEVYADMLLDCFDIGISQHNDGPNGPKRLICEVCITRLRDACNFKKQVLDSEKKFIDMLGRGEFRPMEKQTVLLPIYTSQTPMKAEAIEEVTVTEDYDDSNVEFLDDIDYNEDEDAVKAESKPPQQAVASTSAKRGRPRKTDAEPPEKKLKGKPKTTKIPKEEALKKEQQLAVLLIQIIQESTIVPFRWHKSKFMCFYCPALFHNSTSLREHNDEGHEEINVTDIVNKFMYSDRTIKLDVSTAKCNQCDQRIIDIADFVEHLWQCHGGELDSEVASYFTSFRLSDGEMSCVDCGQHFQFFKPLLTHTNQNHLNNHMCEICGQRIVGKVNIFNHKKLHSVKSCKHCKENFTTQYALFQHVHTIHKTEMLTCTLCGEKQQNRYKMKRHMALVHDCKDSQIVCEFCSKVFTRNNKYVQHKERVHYKKKNISCDLCDYSAYNAEALRVHMVCHNESKPHVCECGKAFRRVKNLTVHRKKCLQLQPIK